VQNKKSENPAITKKKPQPKPVVKKPLVGKKRPSSGSNLAKVEKKVVKKKDQSSQSTKSGKQK
jgi:hypothetical protein